MASQGTNTANSVIMGTFLPVAPVLVRLDSYLVFVFVACSMAGNLQQHGENIWHPLVCCNVLKINLRKVASVPSVLGVLCGCLCLILPYCKQHHTSSNPGFEASSIIVLCSGDRPTSRDLL